MNDSQRLRASIRRGWAELTPGQRKVASYLLKNPDEVAFLTSAELGQRVQVSESTVVRMAKPLGFNGYPELQDVLRSDLRDRTTPAVKLRRQGAGQHVIEEMVAQDVRNLGALQDSLSLADTLEPVVGLLVEARHVYVLGLRSSYCIAYLAAFLLDQVLHKARLITLEGYGMDCLPTVGSGDVLLAVSFPRYVRATTDVVYYAAGQGADTVAITDTEAAPIARAARIAIPVPCTSASFFNSNVAAIAVVNALLAGVTVRRHKPSVQALGQLESMLRQLSVLEDDPSGGLGR